MNGTKKIVTALVASAVALSLFAGCQQKTSPYLVVDGKEVAVPYVLKIGDEKISMEEYRYYYLNTKAQAEMYMGSDIWETVPEMADNLKATSESMIRQSRAIRKLAADNNVSLDDEDQKTIDERLASNKESAGGEEGYQEALTSMYLTEPLLREFIGDDILLTKTEEALYGPGGSEEITDQDVTDYILGNYVRAKHVLINKSETGDAAENAAAKQKAQNVLAQAKNGADFDELIKQYGQDPGTEVYPDGYVFTKGEMVEEFETAAFELAENGLRHVVENTYGYHVLLRLPITDEYIAENKDTYRQSMMDEKITPLLEEAYDSLTVETWEKYDTITPETVK